MGGTPRASGFPRSQLLVYFAPQFIMINAFTQHSTAHSTNKTDALFTHTQKIYLK